MLKNLFFLIYLTLKKPHRSYMIKSKLINNFNKKKIALIVLLIFALLIILGKNYISEVAKVSSIRLHLINFAKVAIPLKNLILMRNVDDKIALLKSSRSCVFCNLTQGNFKGNDLKGVDLRYATLIETNLSNTNLIGATLHHANFSEANLSGANLTNTNLNGIIFHRANLTGANLSGVNLSNDKADPKDLTGIILTFANLSGANLKGADLSNKDLTGTILTNTDLSEANLNGVDLSNKDLTGANLSGVDLSNKDLTGTILTFTNFKGANLNGVDLSNKNLTGANLSGVDLRNIDLTGALIKDAKKIEITLKNPSNSSWSVLNEIQNLNVTRYDLNEDVQYIATLEGLLFESKNNESKLVLDINNDNRIEGIIGQGILGVASQKKLVYVSYTIQDINGLSTLVVDEYSMDFSKVRNIIKIGGMKGHFGGNLLFDNFGKLYLAVGVDEDDFFGAQDLSSLRGKILRLDVSKLKLKPEIVAFGVREPWGVTIDSKDRMFIMQCGSVNMEAVYLLNNLYSGTPPNLGWPVFEGSMRKRKDPLMFKDVLSPIFETNSRPRCLTAGVYLDDIELFLIGDYYGTIGLLKQKESGDWYLLHEYKQEKFIWSFGLDKKSKKIFIAPNNLELEILVDQIKPNHLNYISN